MDFFRFFASFLFLGYCIQLNAGDQISCTSGKVELKVQYDREDLAIYKYDNTKSVNVLLSSVNVTYVDPSKSQKNDALPFLITNIDGIAALTEKNTLFDCDLVIRTKFADGFSYTTQRDLFSVTKSCYEKKICEQLEQITKDDVLRSTLEKYNFGENTVYYQSLSQRYPIMSIENKRVRRSLDDVPKKDADLQTSLNALVDFLLVSGVSYASSEDLGIIKLPDQHKDLGAVFPAKEGHFDMLNGTLGDLTQVLRTENVKIVKDGASFSISIGFQFPNAKISYKKYDFRYSVASGSGTATINVDSITFSVQVILNYNSVPCEISAGYIRSRVEGISFKLSNSGFADAIVNSVVNLAIDTFAQNIVDFLKNLVRTKVGEALKTVDCEKFRPRLV